jgi:endonuclease YncB( thermonuclease family)
MKKLLTIAFLLISIISYAQPSGWNRGLVKTGHDVDTYTIRVNWVDYTIRLLGVDGPELSQCYGKASRDSVLRLIKLKQVDLKFHGKDAYGRWLADVKINGMALDSIIIVKGWGWNAELYGSRFKERNQMQTTAINNLVGLWQYQANCSPWLFRAFNKNEKIALCPCD